MSSLRQIEANRRNALKSTGPTTPGGKDRSRCNALRHGLTAETVIAALEDAQDYQAFEAVVIADYDAESAVERELVLRLASVLWRLRRATGIETALFESVTADLDKVEHPHSRPTLAEAADLPDRNQLHVVAPLQSDADAANEISLNAKTDIGDCFLRLAELPTSALDRLRPLRAPALAASPSDSVYAGVVKTSQAKTEPVDLSILVSAVRARRHVRRVQMTTREINVERADQHQQFQRP